MISVGVRPLGVTCLVGGGLFWALNVGLLELVRAPSLVTTVLGLVLLVCLLGGPLGLLALGAAGQGRTKHIGRIGAGIVLLGLLSYFIGQLYTSLIDPVMGIFYALGALLSGIGMLPLGIAVALARGLPGWRRFAPLLVGLYYLVMIPIQIVFFIGPNGEPSSLLLAGWGLSWALLGYAIAATPQRGARGTLAPADETAQGGVPSA